jgi:hypothetical protein
MKKKWHKPSLIHTGWNKNDSQSTRRWHMIRAHKGDLLASARSCQQISNISTDSETKRKAHGDSIYFYERYRMSKR